MAKKFVRGITDIKTITNQDFDSNNVNDLLSDGKHNYIHRKKQDGSEEYHNLTDNLKTVTSDNTELLEVTNNNDTTNSATLHPKHDSAKEQTLESTRNTITISHGLNGGRETTKVDTNPQKVLEHENLLTDYGISKTLSGNTTKLGIEYAQVQNGYDLNNLVNGRVRASNLTNAPLVNKPFYVESWGGSSGTIIQKAILIQQSLSDRNKLYQRVKLGNSWGEWYELVGDKSVIDNLLSQKQNNLTSNMSIGVDGSGLKQVYFGRTEYTSTNGYLQTYYRSVAPNTNPTWGQEETNYIVKINKNVSLVTFELNSRDTGKFRLIVDKYGENNTVNINGCVFTLSGSTLTVTTANNSEQNYVITFSDII